MEFNKDLINKTIDNAKNLLDPVADKISNGFHYARHKIGKIPEKFKMRYEGLKNGSREVRENLNSYFIGHIEKFKNSFDAEKLFSKLGDVAKTAGVNVVYMVLVLYYALLGKNVPVKDKAMVVAALGYFISPFDFIPDLLGVMGFTDDFAVLMLVFKKIRDNISPEVHLMAKEKLKDLFGEDGSLKLKF